MGVFFGGRIIMKRDSHSNRNVWITITTCLLLLSGYATSQAMSFDAQSGRTPILVQRVSGAARLIIRRIPDLGKAVNINLSIDGVPVATIAYGQTYRGSLTPGLHVLSVFPTPNPKWPTPSEMTLDAKSGHTYTFTVISDSGHLVLLPPGAPEPPRSR
jgi:hypothetical protein